MSTSTWIPPDTFPDRLLRARKARKLTVAQAAAKAGVSPATWSTWERGAHPRDLLDVVQRVSNGLDVDRDWLVWGHAEGTSRSTTAEYVGDIFGGPAASADYLASDLELVA
jgi:transcriptional regulator with XRE-family HTH domain